MPDTNVSVADARPAMAAAAYKTAYRLFAYFGLLSVSGAILFGFQFGAAAPAGNYAFNVLLYGLFIVPHLILTRSWVKRWLWGNPAGHPRERRFYISLTIVTWLGIFVLHRPVPGIALELPPWTFFVGIVLFLIFFRMLFEGVTTPMIDGLLGVPGSVKAYAHGPEAPLFTEGPYAQVRHPMYRAFLLIGLASLLIHPHTGQLLWVALIGTTFILFIPVEEAQMIRARGEDYLEYRKQTPWRIMRGIW
ncbi:MAG: methyltransferase family protein [Planctomycetota bacterium]|jgi:protein-S-isoprenylcysteine O-methyltransferase Ste14